MVMISYKSDKKWKKSYILSQKRRNFVNLQVRSTVLNSNEL